MLETNVFKHQIKQTNHRNGRKKSHTLSESLSSEAFTVLRSAAHMRSDRSSCVKDEKKKKECLWTKFKSRLSLLHTWLNAVKGANMTVVSFTKLQILSATQQDDCDVGKKCVWRGGIIMFEAN